MIEMLFDHSVRLISMITGTMTVRSGSEGTMMSANGLSPTTAVSVGYGLARTAKSGMRYRRCFLSSSSPSCRVGLPSSSSCVS